jgi:hypothetical protein
MPQPTEKSIDSKKKKKNWGGVYSTAGGALDRSPLVSIDGKTIWT